MEAKVNDQYIVRRLSAKPVPERIKRLMKPEVERTPIERPCKAAVPEFLKSLMQASAK